ncbi:MAG TPA: hypothetical protein VN788_11345, partial [Verrucomicrobiae bacterium]|nr:hypothetical protein [Verrucomicrobiae bacterium]
PRPRAGRWTYIVLILSLAFVLMPFLFWRATWFGRPLTNSQLAEYLNPASNPHDVQHALSQVADRIIAGDASVKSFYPQVIALAANPHPEIRAMSAWAMGQDNQSVPFHSALAPMLADSDVNVRRNAALALVRFQDAAGHDIIVNMLRPTAINSPYSGTLRARIKSGESINPGDLLAKIATPSGTKDLRSEIPGTFNRWLANDGSTISAGQPVANLLPSDDEVWESLRALYLIGTPADLDAIAPYARGLDGLSPKIAEQARQTMSQIRSRPSTESSANPATD